jgi:hypothetical protein
MRSSSAVRTCFGACITAAQSLNTRQTSGQDAARHSVHIAHMQLIVDMCHQCFKTAFIAVLTQAVTPLVHACSYYYHCYCSATVTVVVCWCGVCIHTAEAQTNN